MKKVSIYARSSKDLHNVSCEVQEEQLKQLAQNNGEDVVRVFTDKALSSTRDVRPEFDEMISLAMSKNPPFTKIYCLDTSRFGRDQAETTVFLHQLRKKFGIEVFFSQMPHTGTHMDAAFEAIMTAFDYIHSQTSKAKGVASMKQNVRNGYRAGGRAPFGYMLKTIEMGKHRNGEMLTKTKLEPNPDTAPHLKEYFERRTKFEPRQSILDDFNQRGILSPKGDTLWSVSTAKSIEDNIDVYLGNTIFNRINERVKSRGQLEGYLGGKKWRDKEEWVITENTHEPLITQETASIIKEIKDKGLRDAPMNRKMYALSGILKCDICGSPFVGNAGFYRCNSKVVTGKTCPNNAISQDKAEKSIFSLLSDYILKSKNVQHIINKVKQRVGNSSKQLEPLEKRLKEIDKMKLKVIGLYKKGLIEDEEVEKELKSIKDDSLKIKMNINEMRAQNNIVDVDDKTILTAIERLGDVVKNADPKIMKRVMINLFDELRIGPKTGTPWARKITARGIKMPLAEVLMASPRGFEPLSPP